MHAKPGLRVLFNIQITRPRLGDLKRYPAEDFVQMDSHLDNIYNGDSESVFQQLREDYPFLRKAEMKTPEEYFRPGELMASRISSGDLSMISEYLKPIVESGNQNGGVQFLELNPWDSCPLHVVMAKPLVTSIETCQKTNRNIKYFRYNQDPHFGLPDLDCFSCIATGAIVAFPRGADAWSISNKRDWSIELFKHWLAWLIIAVSLIAGLISAVLFWLAGNS